MFVVYSLIVRLKAASDNDFLKGRVATCNCFVFMQLSDNDF